MSSITLANLRTRVLERADMVATSFVSTAELNAIINGEAAELHDLVVSRYEDQFTTSLDFTVTSGSSYTLATSFYKLRGLDRSSGGTWEAVGKSDWASRNRNLSAGGDVAYRIVGSTIQFTPDDGATGTYRLWYIPGYVDLVGDAETLNYPQNWHEYVIAGSAAKCLAKEESDPSVQLALKAQARERILSMGVNRDASANESVRHVQRDWESEDF